MLRGYERTDPIGKAMFKCREAVGLSLAELSALSGVSDSTIARWEMGKSFPRMPEAVLVCDVLGVTIDDYIGRTIIRPSELPKRPKAEWHEFMCYARDPSHGDNTMTLMYMCSRCGRMQSKQSDACVCGADMRGDI